LLVDTVPMQPASSGRLREIECFSNRRLIHPVSAALVPRFARWGVHPNAVSLSGAAAGLMAGYLYHRASFTAGPGFPDGKIAVLLGFALMLAWQVRTLDQADPANCLAMFKSNSPAALVLFLGFVADAALGG